MSDRPPGDQGNGIEAKKLFEAARDHEARGDFEEAKQLYERSLRLREDPVVREAYFSFMATIGPM